MVLGLSAISRKVSEDHFLDVQKINSKISFDGIPHLSMEKLSVPLQQPIAEHPHHLMPPQPVSH